MRVMSGIWDSYLPLIYFNPISYGKELITGLIADTFFLFISVVPVH